MMAISTDTPKTFNRKLRKWDYATLLENARQFSSLNDWQKNGCGGYQAALKRKVQRRIAEDLGWSLPRAWDYASLLENARQFSSLKEWQRCDCGAYDAAYSRGIQRQISDELGWSVPRKHTYETLIDSARRFNSISEWMLGDAGAYDAAKNRGVQRQIAEELGWNVQRVHTYETLLLSASRFSSLSEWRIGDSGASSTAVTRGVFRQIADELGWEVNRAYNYEIILESAKQFNSLAEWGRGDACSYAAAKKRNIQRQIANELGWVVSRSSDPYTYDELLTIAKQFKSLSDWRRGDVGSQSAAIKRGFHREIAVAAGFIDGRMGYSQNKPGVLYYIRIDLAWRSPLYKIGITNFDASVRFKNERSSITIISETYYECGADARAEEKRLHELYSDHRYRGEDRILTTGGDTELFEFDVLGLDVGQIAA